LTTASTARLRVLDPQLLTAAALLAAGGVALVLGLSAGVVGIAAVPGVLRTAAVAVVFFGLCGWGAAIALAPARLAPHRLLLVLPLGATLSSFALTILGLFHVPFKLSLAVVIAAAILAVLRYARGARAQPSMAGAAGSAPAPRGARLLRLGAPLVLAALIALVSLIPIFRSGFETVPGQNGDAILVVGSAVLVEHAPPTATRNDLPINRIPLQWRSKYPIYYALAAVATLAGQNPIQAFATVSAVVLAATALGLFLFALYALRAPPLVALIAMFLVPLDRIVMYVTIHPYYNELWGQFALPFMLLFGWMYLRKPSRRSAALFALFLVFGLLVYPLMLPFPLMFLVPYGWVRWRRSRAQRGPVGWISELRLPRPRSRPWLWVPVVVIAVPVLAVLVRGFVEKALSALDVLLPGTSLANWSGTGLPYLPWPPFLGMPGSAALDYMGVAAVCLLAVVGLLRVRAELRLPLAVMIVVSGLLGAYFRLRGQGQLFFFKDLAFLGPYVLLLALLGLAGLAAGPRRLAAGPRRLASIAGSAGLLAALVVVPAGAAREINGTFDNASPSILGLGAWDRELPSSASVRVDVPPSGFQLWADYMFHDHPLVALNPLGGFFPHPPAGRKADYVLVFRPQARPADAIGPPLRQNLQFMLYRLNPALPGPDVARRGLIWDVTQITL